MSGGWWGLLNRFVVRPWRRLGRWWQEEPHPCGDPTCTEDHGEE